MDHDWLDESESTLDNENQEETKKTNKWVLMEERIYDLFFEMKDYVRDVYETDLLSSLNLDDIAMLLYNQDTINKYNHLYDESVGNET